MRAYIQVLYLQAKGKSAKCAAGAGQYLIVGADCACYGAIIHQMGSNHFNHTREDGRVY
jgi:hypothetical protein